MGKQPGAEDVGAVRTRSTAWEWLSSDKHPRLLPTPWLTDAELEDFTETLLISQRLLGPATRHVRHIERWGVPGDKQDGIDFFGEFSDGGRAAWQVKQLVKLTPRSVRLAVNAVSFKSARELYLVFGGLAPAQAREEMLLHPAWTLIDRRTLTEMLLLLPAPTQRSIIERYWGDQVRRHFLTGPGDAFVTLEEFQQSRLNPRALLNDRGALSGRKEELEELARSLLVAGPASKQVVVVSGPGGRGKSRLLIAALAAQRDLDPTRPIAFLSPSRVFDPSAMQELPSAPGIVVIDDAHIDPAALEPLLAFVRNQPQIQLVLASRPSGLRPIQHAISRSSFRPDEQQLVKVRELSLNAAKRLVNGLAPDLNLNVGLRRYLAEQARHSPHVAVILTNLIRSGELSGAIAVNENLRRTVMARYQELLIPGEIDGCTADTTRRTIATYACLQPVDAGDEALHDRIAAFCGMTGLELARFARELVDRGVFVEQEGALRVVPDVLADQIVEDVVVFERYVTGFVSDLWAAFENDRPHRLAATIGELDWRLVQRGSPSVMRPIWEAIDRRLRSPFPSRLCLELDELAPLASTQPAAVTKSLEELRMRLDEEDASGLTLLDDPSDLGEALYRRVWPGSAMRTRDDVRARMPELYGRAAVNDPDLLEVAVDALLALAAEDSRATNSNTDHPSRVLRDRLCNLATLPHPSFPKRIVERITVWCQRQPDDAAANSLRILKPLLVKEELETVQSEIDSLSFQPHLMSAVVMRPVRDQIRTLLEVHGRSASLQRAAAAIDLLQGALKPPRGYFGDRVTPDAVLAWEDDDLATIGALTVIAESTSSAPLRRYVRKAITWTAEHSESIPLQHAALVLVQKLDASDSVEDAVAQRLVGSPWRIHPATVEVPDVEALSASRAAEQQRTADLSEDERSADRQRRALRDVDAARALLDADSEALALRLLETLSVTQIAELVDRSMRQAVQLAPTRTPTFRSIWQQIGRINPALVPELVDAMSRIGSDTPLDRDIPTVLSSWFSLDASSALEWIKEAMHTARLGVQIAIAEFLADTAWDDHPRTFKDIWATGANNHDERVAQAFLGAAGWYLFTNPTDAASSLLERRVSASAASNALTSSWRLADQRSSGARDEREGAAILSIVAVAGLDDFVAQIRTAEIAATYPLLVLDFLLSCAESESTIPDDLSELSNAILKVPRLVAGWIVRHIFHDPNALKQVVVAATGERLSDELAEELRSLVRRLDRTGLVNLTTVLTGLTIWVPHHLALAESILDRADVVEGTEEIVAQLRRGMTLTSWASSGGVSAELTSGRDACSSASQHTTNERLRIVLAEAVQWYDAINRRSGDDDE